MKNVHAEPEVTTSAFTPLAIVGIGCMFPEADNPRQFWTNIKTGVDSITEVPESHWRAADYFDPDPKARDKVYARFGGFLSPVQFNPMDYGILPNALEAIDTSQLLGLLAVEQALNDAGYGAGRQFDRDRVSVILGVTGTLELVIPLGARLGHPHWKKALQDAGVEDAVAQDVMERIAASYVPWQENSFPGLLGNVVAGRISKHFDFGGTNCVVDAACASSLSALSLAALELAAGRSDMAIAGGVDTFNDIFMYTCFSKTPALSPSGHARPYAENADGTTLGEGLGIVVLKRLADAERDGDRIYAQIKGIGASSDGRGAAIYEPSADGQCKALRRAYEQARVTPDTIELIEGHGTGTRVGDAIEVKALRQVFGEAAQPWCALGSIKSQIGHTKAAAGAAGLIKAALALYHKVLPPTIKVEQPPASLLEEKSPFYVNNQCRPWFPAAGHPRRAGVSALGFGGSNFHCLLEEYQSAKQQVDWNGDVQIVPFSAATVAELDQQLADLPVDNDWSQLRRRAADARRSYDRRASCRLVLVIEKGLTDRSAQTAKARALLDNQEQSWRETPDGIWLALQEGIEEVAFLFPGQGAQYPGMLKNLALQFPEFLDTLADADRAFAAAAQMPQRSLTRLIYPHPFTAAARAESADPALRATDVAQPALGAVSLAATATLKRFALKPAACAGHSYGELVALCVAGVLSAADLHRLSRLRGELMAGQGGDRGTMLAVSAPLADIAAFLSDADLDLVLANRNTPQQGVLSGSRSEIERARTLLQERGIAATPLSVSAAFHSPLVAAAAAPFADSLETVDCAAPQVPVYSNTTAGRYPQEAREIKRLLARQLAEPVDFVNEIKAIREAGTKIFVEVGPGARLGAMVKAILADQPVHVVALDASNGKRCAISDLARLLGKLSALGVPVDLSAWDEAGAALSEPAQPAKKGLRVTLTGANYFNPPAARPPRRPHASPAPVQAPAEAPAVPQQQRRQDNGPGVSPSSPAAAVPAVNDAALAAALQVTQQNIAALQALQQQTARLHQQFLEGQQLATRSFMNLVEQQGQLLGGAAAAAPSVAAEPLAVPTASTPSQSLPPLAAAPATYAPQPATPAPQPVTPAAVTPVTTGPAVADDQISAALLAVIAEKTGYPVEMLELEMSLDSDLGIDSIKRVEILSALQEKLPELPAVRPEDLGVLQTLGQIVDHLQQGHSGTPDSATAAVPVAAAVSGPAMAAEQISAALLAVIAEKTGYPVEMLELEMSLDSDLGIDSIKRVEILSALQEKLPELPAVRPEDLGVLQTLGQIVDHLQQGHSGAADSATAAVPVAAAASGPDMAAATVSAALLAVIAEKTGYPVEMLELEMSLDSDLGIDSIKRVEILSALQEKLPAAPAIKPEHLGTLQTIAQIVDFLTSVSGSERSEPATAILSSPSPATVTRQVLELVPLAKKRPRQHFAFAPGAEVWLTDDGSSLVDALCSALTGQHLIPRRILMDQAPAVVPATLAGLLIVAPLKGTDDRFLSTAFDLLHKLAPALLKGAESGGAFFATVSRLNGCFGLPARTRFNDPLSGGLAGLSKTAALEWPTVHCKALDLAMGMEVAPTARVLVEEIFTVAPLEIGVTSTGLQALELRTEPLSPAATEPLLDPGELVVVSGGARGVTAAVAIALAQRCRPTLVLLGRSPLPETEPDWLQPLKSAAEIKKALHARAGSKLSPRQLQQDCDGIIAAREIRSTLDQILQAGATPIYRSVDLRDGAGVAALMKELQEQYGAIRGVIHGAGVLADKLIVDKTPEQFRQVYDTKVAGCRHLLAAVDAQQLAFLVMFSSSTGRFGRVGQVDYAVANEVLNKIAQHHAQNHPQTRVLSLNWGPWDGGMVTTALKKVFAREGIDVIELAAGAQYLLDELDNHAAAAVELVISGGGQPSATATATESFQNLYVSNAFDLDLSIEQFPFLTSHVIDGKAVLPLAVMVEWLAHAAIHNNPGLKFQGLNDLRVLKGVILEPGQTYNLQAMTGKAIKSDGLHVVPVELSGRDAAGKQIAHARARVVLAARYAAPRPAMARAELPAWPHPATAIYSPERLFHGAAFQGISTVTGCAPEGITALANPAPAPQQWIAQPLRNSWFADPLVLDSSFQLLILWSFEQFRAGSLPVFVGRYRQFQERFPATEVEIRCRIIGTSGQRATADIDFVDAAQGTLIARLENYECVIDASLNATFARNKLIGVA
ncbi:MAG: SDR family NAD(P)-dependent oxidoreductase [Pelovirga sp.]